MTVRDDDETPAILGGPPVRERFLIFGAPEIGEEEIAETVACLKSGWLGTGPRVERFQEAFARYVGAKRALGLNSCTAGLHLALLALGAGPGDEVVTTPMTFAATVNVIEHTGARPVLADVRRDTFCIDPAAAEAALTGKTRVLLPVHFAGRPYDMEAIGAVARRKNLKIVDDGAHAIETRRGALKVGAFADITAFSFYATKNITTGEGGMVVTDDDALFERMKTLSLHGLSRDAWKRYSKEGSPRYEIVEPGFKYNMMDLQAALGLKQLERIDEFLKRRDEIWLRYNDAFKDIEELVTPPEEDGARHARHLYTLLLNVAGVPDSRDALCEALRAEGIGSGIHYRAIHLQPYYREKYGFRPGDFPNAEFISDRTFSIPISPHLTDSDVDDVIRAVRKTVAGRVWAQ